jgi:Ca2+-binding EF-hand superfamily protein
MLQEVWERVDENGDGHLDATEVTRVFKDMGRELSDAEAAAAFAEMDKDGSGEIDFDEAFVWWESQDPEAQAALQESVKAMKFELDELAVRHPFAPFV